MESKKELWVKAFIDEKNVCTDFLNEIADSYIAKTINDEKVTKCAFYKWGELWDVCWRSNDNRMVFRGIDSDELYVSAFAECLKEIFVLAEGLSIDVQVLGRKVIVWFWRD